MIRLRLHIKIPIIPGVLYFTWGTKPKRKHRR